MSQSLHIAEPTELERLRALMAARRSTRAFLPVPVAREQIERALEVAAQAPSWCNTQPWRVYVVAGQRLERLKAELLEAARSGEPAPDVPFVPHYREPFATRRQQAAEALRRARGVAEGDVRGVLAGVMDNYRFFGAPQALLLTVPASFGPYALLDLGCFLHALLLALQAQGLGACAQAALAEYPDVVRRHLPLGADESLVCGVSFGLVDEAASANRCRTARAAVDSFTLFAETEPLP